MTTRPPVSDEPEDLIGMSQLMRLLEEEPEPIDMDEDAVGVAVAPQVTRMPAGIEVRERRLARAVGHWVLQVRCDCGRRWFEVDEVQTADCPRCGALVIIKVEPC